MSLIWLEFLLVQVSSGESLDADVKETLTIVLFTDFAVTVNSFLQNLMLKLFCLRGDTLKQLLMEKKSQM